MKKIPTIFLRDKNDMSRVTEFINPVCKWVLDGEGDATEQYDGTCCMIKDGNFYKRREVKKNKAIPNNFIEAEYDPNTGKRFGWVPVTNTTEDKYHREAYESAPILTDGTYELLGPKVQGNPGKLYAHILMLHRSALRFKNFPRSYNGIKKALLGMDVEGIVFHHPDGRMAKIKKRDFGLSREG